jgi:hypothetical protein
VPHQKGDNLYWLARQTHPGLRCSKPEEARHMLNAGLPHGLAGEAGEFAAHTSSTVLLRNTQKRSPVAPGSVSATG